MLKSLNAEKLISSLRATSALQSHQPFCVLLSEFQELPVELCVLPVPKVDCGFEPCADGKSWFRDTPAPAAPPIIPAITHVLIVERALDAISDLLYQPSLPRATVMTLTTAHGSSGWADLKNGLWSQSVSRWWNHHQCLLWMRRWTDS